ncbi:MAG: translation elongation factor Ts [Gammaproteobacteria bacterium]
MAITAAQVKELRERTGSGMMECKKALTEVNGDMEAAIDHLRKTGQAKADKKSSRVAAEGKIVFAHSDDNKSALIIEVNCETDFAAKDENFSKFADDVAKVALANKPSTIDELNNIKLATGATVEEERKTLIAKIGENVDVRRFEFVTSTGTLGTYSHGNRIGVAVSISSDNIELAKDIAMHIAASKPLCVSADQVDPEILKREKDIYSAEAASSGKPDNIIEKMVEGKIKKYLKEVTLLGQPFVKDPDQIIEKLLESAKTTVESFVRFELGDGIEKKVDNFAEEVMAQAKGN